MPHSSKTIQFSIAFFKIGIMPHGLSTVVTKLFGLRNEWNRNIIQKIIYQWLILFFIDRIWFGEGKKCTGWARAQDSWKSRKQPEE